MKNNTSVPGVYSITHVPSGRRHIGSSKNMHLRWLNHRAKLRAGTHDSRYLQNAWNKHGEDEFAFGVLEVTLNEPTILVAREQHWIDKYSQKLLNCRRIAEQFSQDWYRTPESLETRQKASKRMKDYRGSLSRKLACNHCGNAFTTNNPASGVRFCSQRCRNQYRWKTGQNKEERQCRVCGSDFTAMRSGSQTSCSKKCAHVEKTGLTCVDVPVVIQRVLSGENLDAIALDYKVTSKVIRRLANRETFTNCSIPDELEAAVAFRKAGNKERLKPMDESVVRDIKQRLASGESQKDIAERHQVAPARVSAILRSSTRSSIVMPEEIEEALKERRRNKGLKLSNSDVAEIKRRIQNGDRVTHIAKEFNVSVATIILIKDGRLKYASEVQAAPDQSSSTSPPAVSPGSSSGVGTPEWNLASCSEGIQ